MRKIVHCTCSSCRSAVRARLVAGAVKPFVAGIRSGPWLWLRLSGKRRLFEWQQLSRLIQCQATYLGEIRIALLFGEPVNGVHQELSIVSFLEAIVSRFFGTGILAQILRCGILDWGGVA
ncbi:hypothetical protein D3C78_1270920 [compost metagenome]